MITTGPEILTFEEFQKLFPALPTQRAEEYFPHFLSACKEFDIVTPERIAAFAAQVSHESLQLLYWVEFASGDAYEGRADLGNTEPGDGRRFKGRSPIMLTGRANYRKAGAALGVDLENNPDLAASVEVGFRVAGWYWKTWGCNELADAGDFRKLTFRINGGYNHYVERFFHWRRCRKVMGLSEPDLTA